jgi:hypothetical protein
LLNSVKQIAQLFDFDDFKQAEPIVRFFSIDIDGYGKARTLVQHQIHALIARKAKYCTVLIIRSDESISISAADSNYAKHNVIFLSDWYDLDTEDIEGFFADIGYGYYSLSNGADFISDFVYQVAREYYIHPMSYEYLRFEIGDENVDNLADIIQKYEDDYIDDEYITYENKKIEIEEIDFDLIEYDLEQMQLADDEESDDDYIDDEENEPSEGYDISQIPPEVLSDPVLLLKWLDENNADSTDGSGSIDTEVIDLVNAANIDFIDHRDKGGRFWIFGGYELSDFVEQCKEQGVNFHFKEGGGKATDGFDAWWCY